MRYKPWGEVRSWWTTPQTTTPAYELTQYTFTGQYSYMDDITTQNITEGFGLMFYNARWYDPALGRFAQADTIIPSTQGVQGYDRYAYTNNNPVRYTDPSGHGVDCGIGMGCVQDPPTLTQQLVQYGITISGGAYAQNQSTLQAAQLVGNKIAEALGGGISPEEAFRRTHGDITIQIGQGLGPTSGNCETLWGNSGNVISCNNAPNLTNILHEFGHAFDNFYRNTADPNNLFAGNYFGPTELPRNKEGYKCDRSPCLEHSWIDYPKDPDFGDPTYNFLEEFADMYMNWVLDMNADYPQNGFTSDPIGNARRADMNQHMQNMWLRNLGLLP